MILEIIQDAADFLLAQSYFANIPVLSVNEKDVSNTIDQYLTKIGFSGSSTAGIGVLLGTPSLDKPSADAQGQGMLYFNEVRLFATIFENVQMNTGTSGTGKRAPTVAEFIAATLHWYKPQSIAENIVCTRGPRVVPHKTLLVYDVQFATKGGVETNPQIGQVATPTVSAVPSGGNSTVTIACATQYAFVWYTIDSSMPAPVDVNFNPRVPYTAPFVVPTGTKVRAKAFLPGYLASAAVTQIV